MNGQRPPTRDLLRTDPALTAGQLAHRFALPEAPLPDEPWRAHSLALGTAGTTLLHIERAHTGLGTDRQAHRWITAAATGEVSAADNTGLFLGAPALAFVLHTASLKSPARYESALATLDSHVAALAHRRTTRAMARIRRGELPTFREYDFFYGLTGIGAHLLRRDPGGSALERILRYLVALTRPLRPHGQDLPGWWVPHDPHGRTSTRHRNGHANLGTAHGITGPLLLLAQAARRSVTVDGHLDAITTIRAWLDDWAQEGESGLWWPEYVTLPDLRTGRTHQTGPLRPSWCYGTPGIARAGQLAAIATGSPNHQRRYEHALAQCLTDPAQLDQVTDTGLCHGWAGLYQTTWRAAQDSITPTLNALLPHLAETLTRRSAPPTHPEPGFLEGCSGTALALTTAARNAAPASGWDACLLID